MTPEQLAEIEKVARETRAKIGSSLYGAVLALGTEIRALWAIRDAAVGFEKWKRLATKRRKRIRELEAAIHRYLVAGDVSYANDGKNAERVKEYGDSFTALRATVGK